MERETHLYIISYDIPSDRRRLRAAQLLLGYGERVQESVYECRLANKEVRAVQTALRALLKPDQDRVRIYSVCRACERGVWSIGQAPPSRHVAYIV